MVLEGTISPISVGGLQKRNTNANRIIMSPRFGSLNEWRQTETAVVEGGYTLNEPKRYYIATVRSPERKEASGIADDKTEGRHTRNTLEGTISPRFGSLNEKRQAEAAVVDPK